MEKASEPSNQLPPLTFGQKMVGLTFNPSGLDEVIRCKQFFADLIDKAHDKRNEDLTNWENVQIASDTISALLNAQMWAVKLITWKG